MFVMIVFTLMAAFFVTLFTNVWGGLFTIVACAGYYGYSRYKINHRSAFIDNYQFPKKIKKQVAKKYPHLTEAQLNRVIEQLRVYFHICNNANGKFVSMPSQVVDEAWHEFILFTRAYHDFCKKALGRFLHHTPSEGMATPTTAQMGIKRTWKLACQYENIDPKSATTLPLLFAIDGLFKIEDGFTYALNCMNVTAVGSTTYCATHIGCGGCGGLVSSCVSDGCGGDGGCGGGCGGCGG